MKQFMVKEIFWDPKFLVPFTSHISVMLTVSDIIVNALLAFAFTTRLGDVQKRRDYIIPRETSYDILVFSYW